MAIRTVWAGRTIDHVITAKIALKSRVDKAAIMATDTRRIDVVTVSAIVYKVRTIDAEVR